MGFDEGLWVHRLALTLLPGVGSVLAKSLVSYCGGVEEVFRTRRSKLERIPGIGRKTAALITGADVRRRSEKELQFIRSEGIRPLFYLDDDYPRRLRHCPDAPVVLYFRGTADLNAGRVLGVVGTRNATEYGRMVCDEILGGLASSGVMVVSGLAYGIDIQAHRSALKHGLPTVAVLGHGLDRIYPAQHRSTAEKMLEKGGLLTEFMSGTDPDRENFPRRNRIVAGMVDVLLVVETARKGGAMITAEITHSYNRDIFAVPGRISDPYSAGCNHLVRTNRAALAESAGDILYMMGWDEKEKTGRPVQTELPLDLSPDEMKIYLLLKERGSMHIDELSAVTALNMSAVSAALLKLEFMGLVRSMPGKKYCL